MSAFFKLLGDGVEATRPSGPPRNPFRPDSVNPAPMIRYLMFHLALNLNVVECMSTHHLAPTIQYTLISLKRKRHHLFRAGPGVSLKALNLPTSMLRLGFAKANVMPNCESPVFFSSFTVAFVKEAVGFYLLTPPNDCPRPCVRISLRWQPSRG